MFVFEELSWLELLHSPHGLFGGDGDDAGDDYDSDESAENLESDDEDDDGDEDGSSDVASHSRDDDDDDDDQDVDVRSLLRENRKLSRDLKAALELLDEYEERGMSDSDDDDDDLEILRSENEQLRALLNGQYVRNAITSFRNKDGSPKWDWVDVDDVFNALDADDLDIDIETGEIDGLEEQLEDIARRKPHWLRKKQKKEDDAPGGPTGYRPRSGGRGKDKMTAEDYVKKHGAAYSILTR